MERRTIDELVTRYELEPTLRDVWVEGVRDEAFITWLAQAAGLSGIATYAIENVEVPVDLVLSRDLHDSNAGRVITFVEELQARASRNLYKSVAGIADGDLHYARGRVFEAPLLILTDFTSREMYLCDSKIIAKYLHLVSGRSDLSADSVLAAVLEVCRVLFAVRLASAEMKVGLGLIAFDRCCEVKAGKLIFDWKEYTLRYITRGEHASKRDVFTARVSEVLIETPGEIRHWVHGHDFLEVLHWVLRRMFRVIVPKEHDEFARSIWGCLEFESVNRTRLIEELTFRFA